MPAGVEPNRRLRERLTSSGTGPHGNMNRDDSASGNDAEREAR